MKNEKRTVFRFPFLHESEKRMKVLKIKFKNKKIKDRQLCLHKYVK